MLRIHELPEAVVDAVGPHLHHHEKIPRTSAQQVLGHGESLRCHFINLAQQPLLLIGAESPDVHHIIAHQLLHFGAKFVRVSELTLRSRSQKATDQTATQRLHRISWRNANDDTVFALPAKDVPKRFFMDAGGVRDREPAIAVIAAVSEPIDTQFAGVPAGHHAHPGGHGDRRGDAAELAVHASMDHTLDVGQVIEPVMKHQFRVRTIQPDYHHLSLRCPAKQHSRLTF